MCTFKAVETNADLQPLMRMPALRLRRTTMPYKEIIASLSMIVATSPISAAQPEPTPQMGAPTAAPDARYCLRVEAVTGVDVDKDWAEEGVRVIGARRT